MKNSVNGWSQLGRVGKTADLVSKWAGSSLVVSISLLTLILFFILGPFFNFSIGYQLVSNTFMSAVSYLMLFVLQHTQVREGKVLQLKLDALLHAMENADKRLISSEDLSEEELDVLSEHYRKLALNIKNQVA